MSDNIKIDQVKLKEMMKLILSLESKNLKTKELNNKEVSFKIKDYIKEVLNKNY